MTHTPTPWIVSPPSGMYGWEVVAGHGLNQQLVCQLSHHPAKKQEAADNAALIVRAVNAHDELVAALNRSLSWLSSYPGGGAMEAYDQARAALAKAKG